MCGFLNYPPFTVSGDEPVKAKRATVRKAPAKRKVKAKRATRKAR